MKRRTLAGSFGVGVFVIAFLGIAIAFATPSWLVSDYRITGAKLDRLGLWVHCFRSLPDINDDFQRRFFVGCRWIYDPFTTGYDEIRGFLLPRELKFNEKNLVRNKTHKLFFYFQPLWLPLNSSLLCPSLEYSSASCWCCFSSCAPDQIRNVLFSWFR